MEKQKLKEKANGGVLSVRNTRKNLPNCAPKQNKGITLVALIITIIVLLILAVVAISTVSETGIIGKAKESQTAYNQAQANEQAIIGNYESYIENNIPKKKTYSFTVGDLLAKVKDNAITLADLKELCNDEKLEISNYLTNLDDTTLCYTSSNNSVLASIETWLDRMKNDKLNGTNVMLFTTDDNGETFGCSFLTYTGDLPEDLEELPIADISQEIKDTTITLSDKTDFDLSWL